MKRILAFIMPALVIAALLTGCQAERKTAAPAAAAGRSLGTPDNPVVVTYLLKDSGPTIPDDIDYTKKLEENMAALGMYIKLEILESPPGDYAVVVPLAIRTGQLTPDIIYFQGGDLSVAQDGLLEDLRPYVKNSTYVKDLMLDFSAQRLENYPYLLYLSDISLPVPAIRTDILNKLKSGPSLLENPSIENYYAMFKEIVEGGYATYAITTDAAIRRFDTIFNQAFGVTSTIMNINGRYVYGVATQFEKAKLEFYAKLYAEGLIDPEYLTKGWELMEQYLYTGEVAMISGTCGAVIDIYNTKVMAEQGDGAILTVLPPAKGVKQGYLPIDVSKESRGRAIYADSKVKDAAWAVMEYMASPEGRLLDLRGVEGVHYNVVNGMIIPTERFNGWWTRMYSTINMFNPNPPLAGPIMSQPGMDSLAMAEQYAVNDINVVVPENLVSNWDAMMAIYNDYSTDIIRGRRPISDFDKMVDEWNAAGGDAFAEYLATVLN